MNLHEMIHNAWEDALVDAATQSPQDDFTEIQGNIFSLREPEHAEIGVYVMSRVKAGIIIPRTLSMYDWCY